MHGLNRCIDHRIRSLQVSLHQHRRNVQRRTDIIKPLSDSIFGQHLFDGNFHFEEIANRVLVFDPIQPPQDDSTFSTPLSRNRIQARRELFHQLRDLLRFWPRLVFRWHLASLNALHDFAPLVECR